MHQEIAIAAWGAVLLFVHIMVAAQLKTSQYGVGWNVGARDEAVPPLGVHAGRAVRAQANFLETFPIAIVTLLGVAIADRTSGMTALGGWLWLGARVVYLPVYLLGIKGVRSALFLVSLAGLGIVLWPLLAG